MLTDAVSATYRNHSLLFPMYPVLITTINCPWSEHYLYFRSFHLTKRKIVAIYIKSEWRTPPQDAWFVCPSSIPSVVSMFYASIYDRYFCIFIHSSSSFFAAAAAEKPTASSYRDRYASQ
jgi:hypothetical protein